MEILFGLATLAIALVSFTFYRTYKEKQLKRFGLGFLFISLSYLIWASINLIIARNLENGFRIISFEGIPVIYVASTYVHMGLFIIGLVTLAYTTFKVEKGSMYYLLLALGLLVVASSFDKLVTFRILSVFLLIFISYNYFMEWTERRNKKTLTIFISFVLLLLSNLDFIFSEQYYMSYIIGHMFELCAYALMLISLVRTLKK